MNDLGSYMKRLIKEEVGEVHTTLPAKIESYDAETLRADVVLLARNDLEGESVEVPPIINCPVQIFKAGMFVIRPPYKKGDVVKVDFSERALDKLMLTGNSEDPRYTRRHSFDDAIITGGLRVEEGNSMPAEHASDLYIANIENPCELIINEVGDLEIDNETTHLIIHKDGPIELITDDNIDIKAIGNVDIECDTANIDASNSINLGGGAEPIPLGTSLMALFNGHDHIGNKGAPTSPPTTPMGSSELSSLSNTD